MPTVETVTDRLRAALQQWKLAPTATPGDVISKLKAFTKTYSPQWRGSWTVGAEYSYNDMVSWGGSLYIVNDTDGAAVGVAPPSSDWDLMV